MKNDVRRIIEADLYRYHGTRWSGFWRAFLTIPPFRYTYYLRQCHYYRGDRTIRGRLGLYYNLAWLNHWQHIYGYQISTRAEIGPGLTIAHCGHIIIHSDAKLGRDTNLSVGITIGQTNRGPKRGVPRLGDRVWIGTNSVIVGGITVGNDVMIGPGAYVNFDVPDRAVVVGNPGRIVSYRGSGGYVEHLTGDVRP